MTHNMFTRESSFGRSSLALLVASTAGLILTSPLMFCLGKRQQARETNKPGLPIESFNCTMGTMEWIETQGNSWRTGADAMMTAMPLPSITHVLSILIILALWKFPRSVSAFDPNPRQSSSPAMPPNNKKHSNPTFPSPLRPPHPPTPIGSSSDADSVSTASVQSRSSSESLQQQQQQQQQSPIAWNEPSLYMKSQAPESTSAERHRFLVARNGNEPQALKNLQKCLQWRQAHAAIQCEQEQRYRHIRDDDGDQDLYDWIVASQTALRMNHPPQQQQQANGNDNANYAKNNNANLGWQFLPRVAKTLVLPNGCDACDVDGHRIIHLTPALMDDHICSLHTYALAIALYLDRKVDRSSMEKITLTLDLRPGEGWRNIPGVRLIPFIKDIVKLLLAIFPERLHKSVIYPLPFALSWIFSAIKTVIDPETAKKLYILSGSAGMVSPLPVDQMAKHVSRDIAMVCEKERLESFSLC